MMTRHDHVLPDDRTAGMLGDVSWFERYSPFIQAETRRQVAFKRRTWPDLPPGEHSKREGHFYPHLLPAEHAGLNVYEPVRNALTSYLEAERIARHSTVGTLACPAHSASTSHLRGPSREYDAAALPFP
jgi:hypothetical protein